MTKVDKIEFEGVYVKDKTYLIVSILALVGGICLIVIGDRKDIFSIGLVLMGVVGTLAGMFLLMNPEEKKEDKAKKKIPVRVQPAQPHVCDHSHCVEKVEKIVDTKIVCKYCKCKYAKTFDKCPYCGAPQNG